MISYNSLDLYESYHSVQEDYLMNAKQKLHQIRLQEWAGRFAEQKASGLTVRQWCEVNHFSFHTYNYWKHLLKEECSRSKFLSKLLKTFDKTFREIFPVFISTKRREKPSAFFDNNFVNNAYFSEAASSSSSHLASSSSKAPISSRMTCLCLWSS